MGCHTWIYKKFAVCTHEQKQAFLDECNREVEDSLEPYEQFEKEMKETADLYMRRCQKNSPEYRNWKKIIQPNELLRRYNEQYEKYVPFKGGVTEENVLEFCKIDEFSAKYVIEDNCLYLETDGDNVFRVYNYPEDTFNDLEELLKWLSTQKKSDIGYYNYKNEFVPGYTVELVDRIRKYFEENGPENIFIEFE